ncbi:MAG: hypothetical protein JSR26_02470 [Proteobacteria bacterium]|nr:hypothetical protein [Pseudomonadota bacterium]
MHLRARHRLRIALTVIVCLLFQQLAMAAYVCAMETKPADLAVMSSPCAAMGMQVDKSNPALCAKHCAPDLSTTASHGSLTVPPAMLPSITIAAPTLPVITHVAAQTAIPIDRSDPPPRLRYCSLLI